MARTARRTGSNLSVVPHFPHVQRADMRGRINIRVKGTDSAHCGQQRCLTNECGIDVFVALNGVPVQDLPQDGENNSKGHAEDRVEEGAEF